MKRVIVSVFLILVFRAGYCYIKHSGSDSDVQYLEINLSLHKI
jgi:hypothetical protein